MFTIEVKKREKDEEFILKDLEMFHQECYGGRITPQSDYQTICSRCGNTSEIDKEVTTDIIKTAIDGEKRKLTKLIKDDDGDIIGVKYAITVIQKT